MYYNITIEIDEKDTKGNYLVARELDKQNLNEIKKYILIPYLKREEIFIDGRRIDYKKIRKINIFKADKTTKNIVGIAQSTVPTGVFFFYQADYVINKRFMTDITTEILSATGEILKKDERNKINDVIDKSENNANTNKIFIVHGKDNEIKTEIARFIENLGLRAIILHEQSNDGRTIIEKIEQNTNVSYGIVIYTPCDKGGEMNQNMNEYKPRARQNVLFEHGYLLAKLGRNRVSAIVKQGIETPSDISGLVYIEHDQSNGWKLKIAQELANAGFGIDMNLLLNH